MKGFSDGEGEGGGMRLDWDVRVPGSAVAGGGSGPEIIGDACPGAGQPGGGRVPLPLIQGVGGRSLFFERGGGGVPLRAPGGSQPPLHAETPDQHPPSENPKKHRPGPCRKGGWVPL